MCVVVLPERVRARNTKDQKIGEFHGDFVMKFFRGSLLSKDGLREV